MHTIITRHCRLLKLSKFFSTLLRRRDTEHFFLVVKIARITRSFTFRDERSFKLFLGNGNPVCSTESSVTSYIIDSILQITISFCQVNLEQLQISQWVF